MSARITIFGRQTNLVEKRDFEELVSELAVNAHQTILFCNVHMLMLSQEDQVLASAMDSADWVFADGVPIAWLQKWVSGKDTQVIRGYEIMLAVCDRAARNGEKVGFIGSTPDVMTQLVSRLSERFKGLNVAYHYCPPFMPGDLILTPEELQDVSDSGISWLFVGLGCPKQEKWIANYRRQLNCQLLGVGAAFDWLSGSVSMPPGWMERFALGWLYRLLKNPTKMWRRYLIYNTKFLLALMRQFVERRLTSYKSGKNHK